MKKFRKILVISTGSLLFLIVLITLFEKHLNNLFGWVLVYSIFLAILSFTALLSTIAFGKNFYNYSLWVIGFAIIVLILKYFNIQGSSFFLAIVFLLLSIGFIILSIRALIIYKSLRYLQVMGFVANLVFVVSFFSIYAQFLGTRFQSIIYTGILFFILLNLALLFTLPNAGIHQWSGSAKRFLYRSILLPMIFVFALNTLVFVFPEISNKLFDDTSIKELKKQEIRLKPMEGIYSE